jgi:hypothetical protein
VTNYNAGAKLHVTHLAEPAFAQQIHQNVAARHSGEPIESRAVFISDSLELSDDTCPSAFQLFFLFCDGSFFTFNSLMSALNYQHT